MLWQGFGRWGGVGGAGLTIDGQLAQYVGSGTQGGTNTLSGTINPSLPTGWAIGDYHILVCETDHGDTVATPTGYTLLGAIAGASHSKVTAFGRVAQSGDGAPTVTNPGDHVITVIHGFRGVDTANPIDVSGTVADAGTALAMPSVTTTGPNRKIVGLVSLGGCSAYSNSGLNGLAERTDAQTSVGGGGGLTMFTSAKAAAGSTGSTSVTAGVGDGCGLITLALKPALVGSSPSFPASLFYDADGAWYDPSDLSTLFQDTAGTTPVTTTGQTVALMRDKSGHMNHLTQSTSGSRPTLQQDGGGRYYLDFDGGDFMDSALPLRVRQPMCMAIGFMPDSPGGGSDEYLVNSVDTSGGFRCGLLIRPGGNFGLHCGSEVSGSAGSLSAATAYVGIAQMNGSSSVGTLNGVDITGLNPGSNDMDRIRVGAFQSGSAHFDGRLYGLIVAFKAISGTEKTNISDYLETQSGASF